MPSWLASANSLTGLRVSAANVVSGPSSGTR